MTTTMTMTITMMTQLTMTMMAMTMAMTLTVTMTMTMVMTMAYFTSWVGLLLRHLWRDAIFNGTLERHYPAQVLGNRVTALPCGDAGVTSLAQEVLHTSVASEVEVSCMVSNVLCNDTCGE